MQSVVVACALMILGNQSDFKIEHLKVQAGDRLFGIQKVSTVTVEVPIRTVAQILDHEIELGDDGSVNLAPAKDRRMFSPSGVRGGLFRSIYLNGRFAVLGRVREGTTFVDSEDIGKLGLKMRADFPSDTLLVARIGEDFTKPQPGIPIEFARDKPIYAKGSLAEISIIRPAMIGSRFSAEVHISEKIFKPTSKPITAEFQVVLFDDDGNILSRDTCNIYRVSSGGGDYILDGPFVVKADSVTRFAITFRTGWVSKD